VDAQIDGTALPSTTNWNSNGGATLVHGRYYAGGTLESSFIFIVGGISENAAAATTERTVL
jgi:hypothetical protein